MSTNDSNNELNGVPPKGVPVVSPLSPPDRAAESGPHTGSGGGRPPLPPHQPRSPVRQPKQQQSPQPQPQPPTRQDMYKEKEGRESWSSQVSALSADDSPHAASANNYANDGGGNGDSRRGDAAAQNGGKTHKEGVSWDFALGAIHDHSPTLIPSASAEEEEAAAAAGGDDAPPSIMQPDLTTQERSGAPPPRPPPLPKGQGGGGEGPPPPRSPMKPRPRGIGAERSRRHVRKATNITLADIAITPFEDEAETAILRALEEREWEIGHDEKIKKAMGHERKKTALSNVLPNVHDEAMDLLQQEEGSKSKEPTIRSTEGLPTVPARRDGMDKKKPTLKTLAGQLKMMQIGAGSFVQGGGGYLQKAQAAAEASTRKLPTTPEAAPPSPKRPTEPEPITGTPGAPPLSEADNLVNNADILLGEQIEFLSQEDGFDLEAQLPTPTAPTGSRWAKVRGGVRASAAFKSAAQEGAREAGNEGEGGADDDDNEDADVERPTSPTGYENNFRQKARRRANKGKGIMQDVFIPKIHAMKLYSKTAVLIMLPMLAIAAILFYAAGNPIAGCTHRDDDKSRCASYSWWLIFLGNRQVVTFSLAKATEVIFVDILALRTTIFLRIFGPYVTLLAVQARGWPFVLTYWAIWDFIFLHGPLPFHKHWLYYQNVVGMFNNANQAGVVVNSNMYMRVLIAAIVMGLTSGVKRMLLALYQGMKSSSQYGPKLEKLMRKMVLLAEVARLADEIQAKHVADINTFGPQLPWNFKNLRRVDEDDDDDDDNEEEDVFTQRSASTAPKSPNDANKTEKQAFDLLRLRKNTEDMTKTSTRTGLSMATTAEDSLHRRPTLDHQPRAYLQLCRTAKIKLEELVGEWEEPEIMAGSGVKDISIQDVLQFRQAVLCLDDKFPFSTAFGSVKTRETCIESAQDVFERLLLHSPGSDRLTFETIAIVALDQNGQLDEDKAKRLIRLFRPDRDGHISVLDFVRSCDRVYKNMRTLRAAIANSSQIDHAMEMLVNVLFYFILLIVVLQVMTVQAWTLFISLSGFILSFAFMFGAAASKYFEGILLILVRRPYDIGDRIHISNPQNDTSSNGSATWFVEGVTLYTTTVRYAATNEVATYSNGSLASMRIINGARSPKGTVYIYLKFASDVPFEKVMVFKSVIERFVKDRPRQWLAMNAFRATRVESDLGFIEYVLVLQHVEAWQNIGPILNSKAELASYCLEVQKKLDMKYVAPPLPVNLAIDRARNGNVDDTPLSQFETSEIGEEVVEKSSEKQAAGPPDLRDIASLFKPEPKKTK